MRLDVALGPLSAESAERMLGWVRTVELAEDIGLASEPSLEKTVRWIECATSRNGIWAWAIRLSGEHVGNVVFDQFDPRAASARISIYLGSAEDRGLGIGSTALRLALDRAFSEGGLYRVWLTVHAENQRALRTYLRLGFQKEGTLREAFVRQGRRVDAYVMGLLRRDFLAGGEADL